MDRHQCQAGAEAPAPQMPHRPSLRKSREEGEGAGGGREHTWGLYPLVVVGIHADLVLLHVESELTQLHGPQLMVAVQIGPSPQAAVDDMGEPLPMGYLQSAIQGPARWGGATRDSEVDLACLPLSSACCSQ